MILMNMGKSGLYKGKASFRRIEHIPQVLAGNTHRKRYAHHTRPQYSQIGHYPEERILTNEKYFVPFRTSRSPEVLGHHRRCSLQFSVSVIPLNQPERDACRVFSIQKECRNVGVIAPHRFGCVPRRPGSQWGFVFVDSLSLQEYNL